MRTPIPVLMIAAVIAAGCATTGKRETAQAAKGTATQGGAADGCAAVSTLVPGGIADATGGILFLRTDEGMEAVETATGFTLWRSPNAVLPLAVSEQHLAAAAPVEDRPHTLRLSLHDRATGALLSLGPLVDVGADLSDGLQLQAAFCGASQLDLIWSDVGGNASGLRADLETRKVVGPPGIVPVGGASYAVGSAQIGDLSLRREQGQLRAFTSDGALRWERPVPRGLFSAL